MIKFNNHFENPVKVENLVYDKTDTVERAGVIPLRAQIKSFKEAGVLLKATRALQYDTDQDVKDLEKVETIFNSAGVDYSDMSELTARAAALKRVQQSIVPDKHDDLNDVNNPAKIDVPPAS